MIKLELTPAQADWLYNMLYHYEPFSNRDGSHDKREVKHRQNILHKLEQANQ